MPTCISLFTFTISVTKTLLHLALPLKHKMSYNCHFIMFFMFDQYIICLTENLYYNSSQPCFEGPPPSLSRVIMTKKPAMLTLYMVFANPG